MIPLPEGYEFATYLPTSAEALIALEYRAAQRFAEVGYPHLSQAPPLTSAEWTRRLRGADIWVVAKEDVPCGFAIGTDLGDLYWICEISVDPDHGGRGIGAALLAKAVERANWAFHSAIGLSTFRAVAFNAPFYAKHGFLEVPVRAQTSAESDPAQSRFWLEVPKGVHPSARTLMIKRL